MATQGERIGKLEHVVFGNGEAGMDENVRNLVDRDIPEIKAKLQKIADHTGPTYSEMEALKRAIFERLDKDALGNSIEYDESNHPSRRSGDVKTLSDKLIGYLVEKVLPQIITWAILGYIGFQIAVNNHLIHGL